MTTIVWTPQARRDVVAIEDYYLDVAPAYAELVGSALLSATRRLETFPHSGRIVPEVNDPAIREVVWREYRVIYHATDDGSRVDVLTVLHSSQQFGS